MASLRVDPATCTDADLARAVAWLRAGGVVVFPTETFYGLAVDPRSAGAVASVFDLKGRPAALALPLVAASLVAVESWCGPLLPRTRRLAERFWPGPLSLLVEGPADLAAGVAGRDGSVAIRVPGHRVAATLAGAFGAPVTATSANRSGRAPARHPGELGEVGRDPRVLIVDAGETAGGLPSTIVDARREPPALVREGAVPWERVLESLY
jgi:L-threonylcarbamoyladenylate synthase